MFRGVTLHPTSSAPHRWERNGRAEPTNPDREKEVSEMNQGVSSESAEAESVGTQMSVAARYLFFISYIIAEDTVALTL